MNWKGFERKWQWRNLCTMSEFACGNWARPRKSRELLSQPRFELSTPGTRVRSITATLTRSVLCASVQVISLSQWYIPLTNNSKLEMFGTEPPQFTFPFTCQISIRCDALGAVAKIWLKWTDRVQRFICFGSGRYAPYRLYFGIEVMRL
jgi:hypothetical protein